MGRLENKVAVITGAASGIGRESAIRFAREGASVVLCDLNAADGEAAAQECVTNGARAAFIRADVAAEDDIAASVALAVKEFGRLDIMFNNAGIGGAVGPIENISVENWDRTIGVLVRSVFLGMKHSIPQLRKAGGGAIISTASVAGLRGGGAPHAYSASKAAVINLTRSVAIEVARDRIRVNCICPGGIVTPLLYKAIPGASAEVASQFLAQAQPIPRAGTPTDVAAMALFLASDEADWITGAAMVVDGGMTARIGIFDPAATPYRVPGDFAGPSFEL